MARMVQCVKLGREAEGLDFPPLPGELGKRLAAIGDAQGLGIMRPVADLMYRLRIAKYGRDLSEIHRRLYARGLAVPLGVPFRTPRTRPPDDLVHAVERVRALIARPGV